jgi:golgi to ER traffic protein 4
VINFAQLAVLTCQRAQGERNKVMRESWVRLCGTYQSRGGVLAQPEVRKVSTDTPIQTKRLPSTIFQVLQDLATLYFAIPPPRSQPANPFGDMMSSLFGGAPGGGQPARRVLAPASAGSGSAGLD